MAILFSPPFFRATDITGAPVEGAFLGFYKTGTSTLQPIWSDVSLSIPLTNPLQSDGNGWFPAVWLDDALPSYKFVLSAPDVNTPSIPGAVLRTGDPYNTTIAQAQTAAETSAFINPVNLSFAPGDVRRYGAVGDGAADDTTAVTNALLVGSQSGGPEVVLPSTNTFKLTSYVEIHSNTTLRIEGIVLLTNRASGFFSNGATNIFVTGGGTLIDTTVQSNYIWNNNNLNGSTPQAPAFHFRSSVNVTVESLIFNYINSGVLFSNQSATNTTIAGISLSQVITPAQCTVRGCNFQFMEMSSMACYNGTGIVYDGNYVYRSGDGGIWMMTCGNSSIRNNQRISPSATPTDVAAHSSNNAAFPTTWNDEQGIEIEGCFATEIAHNIVQNFWGAGIDVKNNCNRVLVIGNQLSGCEQNSICTRDGDGVKNACSKVSIIANTISEHGTLHYNQAISFTGAIRTGETFICEILNNVIYAYQTTGGIMCMGPGAYQASWYLGSPHEASLIVQGNSFDFKNTSFTNGSETIGYNSATLSAIYIVGQYDAIKCDDNKITADQYLSSDTRVPSSPAISLIYVSANSAFYPNICSISGNVIANGWNGGIVVTGQDAFSQSGLKVNENVIGALYAGNFIQLNATHYASVSGNQLSQVGHGGQTGIQITGSSGHLVLGAVVNNNVIGGGMSTAGGIGTNSMSYGVGFTFCQNCVCTGNRVAIPATGNVLATSCAGDIITRDTTGFPRTGAGTPVATVTSLYFGEMYFDSSGTAWYSATAAQATTWTKLTN